MADNLIRFLQQRSDVFPMSRDIDLQRFLQDVIGGPESLPKPAKLFLADDAGPHAFGFPVMRSPMLDDLEAKFDHWVDDETRAGRGPRAEESLQAYRTQLVKLARNALHSSILADYHSVFWLVHSGQTARIFSTLPRRMMAAQPDSSRDKSDQTRYLLFAKWAKTVRGTIPEIVSRDGESARSHTEHDEAFLQLILDNPLLATEEFISTDFRELRSYFSGYLRRDFAQGKRWLDEVRTRIAEVLRSDRLFRRAVLQLGYGEGAGGAIAALDPRVQQLLFEHSSYRPSADQALLETTSRRLLQFFIVYYLRRSIVWMRTTPEGDNFSDDEKSVAYSRGIRAMNFGRRGVVEPIVYRYGLVYDITSFTQTLGEIVRGGKDEEQTSYRQMLEFQRDLGEISKRHALQFEKFLGDGAFYTSRRATRTLQAAIDIQRFYASAKARGFAFNKGMRIALNYGYYRLLPMQVASDGTEIKEFYGPGIVELSRLTTGKTTKEIEDVQHLLLSHGYDQMEVYRFFAPLARGVDNESSIQQRDFYAYVNESGHLINEGIVASIPFLKQLSAELQDEKQKIYRLRTPYGVYMGYPFSGEGRGYIGVRILGSVSLKGIGNVEVAEVVHLASDEAEVSLVDEIRPFLQLLQQERNRTAVRALGTDVEVDEEGGSGDLVVCESKANSGGSTVILVGEWDPVTAEVRRPIRLGDFEAERYGLAVPLTAESVELQSSAYQNLYRKLSRMETLPSFSVDAIRHNSNFSGFIIGATVERL